MNRVVNYDYFSPILAMKSMASISEICVLAHVASHTPFVAKTSRKFDPRVFDAKKDKISQIDLGFVRRTEFR